MYNRNRSVLHIRMRVFLSICILVATTVAHPTGPCCPSESCPPPPPPPCDKPCPPPPCDKPCPSSCEQPPPPSCEQPPTPSCESSSEDSCTSESSTTISISTTSRFVCDKSVYPSVVPADWNIVTFDTQAVSTDKRFKITNRTNRTQNTKRHDLRGATFRYRNNNSFPSIPLRFPPKYIHIRGEFRMKSWQHM